MQSQNQQKSFLDDDFFQNNIKKANKQIIQVQKVDEFLTTNFQTTSVKQSLEQKILQFKQSTDNLANNSFSYNQNQLHQETSHLKETLDNLQTIKLNNRSNSLYTLPDPLNYGQPKLHHSKNKSILQAYNHQKQTFINNDSKNKMKLSSLSKYNLNFSNIEEKNIKDSQYLEKTHFKDSPIKKVMNLDDIFHKQKTPQNLRNKVSPKNNKNIIDYKINKLKNQILQETQNKLQNELFESMSEIKVSQQLDYQKYLQYKYLNESPIQKKEEPQALQSWDNLNLLQNQLNKQVNSNQKSEHQIQDKFNYNQQQFLQDPLDQQLSNEGQNRLLKKQLTFAPQKENNNENFLFEQNIMAENKSSPKISNKNITNQRYAAQQELDQLDMKQSLTNPLNNKSIKSINQQNEIHNVDDMKQSPINYLKDKYQKKTKPKNLENLMFSQKFKRSSYLNQSFDNQRNSFHSQKNLTPRKSALIDKNEPSITELHQLSQKLKFKILEINSKTSQKSQNDLDLLQQFFDDMNQIKIQFQQRLNNESNNQASNLKKSSDLRQMQDQISQQENYSQRHSYTSSQISQQIQLQTPNHMFVSKQLSPINSRNSVQSKKDSQLSQDGHSMDQNSQINSQENNKTNEQQYQSPYCQQKKQDRIQFSSKKKENRSVTPVQNEKNTNNSCKKKADGNYQSPLRKSNISKNKDNSNQKSIKKKNIQKVIQINDDIINYSSNNLDSTLKKDDVKISPIKQNKSHVTNQNPNIRNKSKSFQSLPVMEKNEYKSVDIKKSVAEQIKKHQERIKVKSKNISKSHYNPPVSTPYHSKSVSQHKIQQKSSNKIEKVQATPVKKKIYQIPKQILQDQKSKNVTNKLLVSDKKVSQTVVQSKSQIIKSKSSNKLQEKIDKVVKNQITNQKLPKQNENNIKQVQTDKKKQIEEQLDQKYDINQPLRFQNLVTITSAEANLDQNNSISSQEIKECEFERRSRLSLQQFMHKYDSEGDQRNNRKRVSFIMTYIKDQQNYKYLLENFEDQVKYQKFLNKKMKNKNLNENHGSLLNTYIEQKQQINIQNVNFEIHLRKQEQLANQILELSELISDSKDNSQFAEENISINRKNSKLFVNDIKQIPQPQNISPTAQFQKQTKRMSRINKDINDFLVESNLKPISEKQSSIFSIADNKRQTQLIMKTDFNYLNNDNYVNPLRPQRRSELPRMNTEQRLDNIKKARKSGTYNQQDINQQFFDF